jgi:ankyrin repeat protein
MMRRNLPSIACLLSLAATTVAAQEPSDRFYQAIRNNDLASLRTLVKTSDVNTKDQRESTPLMYAAAYGSLDAMKVLLDAGADVNARNTFEVSALLWCASDLAKVRLLVEKGADVNARSKQGRTALLIAAAHDGNSQTVKLLIEKGAADVSAPDKFQFTPLSVAAEANDAASVQLLLRAGADVNTRVNALDHFGDTALLYAASHGNIETMKQLLAKGADVNAVGKPQGPSVKNGPLGLGSFTPLLFAAAYGGSDAVKLLLDAGAKVNVQDARGMTPLMLAIATDRPDPRVVRLLLEKGADPTIKSKDGETAVDWAKKFNYPPVLAELGVEHKQIAAAEIVQSAGDGKLPSAKDAAGKSIALLQRTSGSFFKEGGCASCHAQNLTGLAVSVARANGIKVDEAAAAEQLKTVKVQWAFLEQVLLQRVDTPGAVDIPMYSLLHLAAEGVPPDRSIDAVIHNMACQQRKDGSWHYAGIARPPMEDGDFSRTALSIRALAIYGPPGLKAEFDQRIQRAAAWLKRANPRTTEDRNMQLLGLKWANADRRSLEDPLKNLIALHRPDGGWAQTPDLWSDAYATGTVLYVMHELGVPASDAAYRRGVAYLLRTQMPDGSWQVASRAPKFQPYFQSGFPHDHDQWISGSATAWAAIALSNAVTDPPSTR